MKNMRFIKSLVVLFLLTSQIFSQINLKGSLNSSLFSWENSNENQQWDYYQGLNLKLAPANSQNIYFKTYLRAAYRGDPAEWQERVYHIYLNWNVNKNIFFRVGRQFLYQGVMTGTIDGALLSSRLVKNLHFKAVVGTEAPYTREFDVRSWDDGNVLGVYLSYLFPGNNNLDLSYFQKTRRDDLYWQQLGTVFSGYINKKFQYLARIDYNLLQSEYQLMRYRLSYLGQKWFLSTEFSSSKPRIYEDSFFNIFEVEAHNQFRLAATRKIGKIDLGLQFLHTLFDEDSDNRLIGTFSHRIGTVGLIYQSGYGGENMGYFGEINYEFLPNLTAKIYNSFYNYERATTNISEEALSFSSGLSYRVKNLLILSGELQETSNSYYNNDWRGLFRLTYLFKN